VLPSLSQPERCIFRLQTCALPFQETFNLSWRQTTQRNVRACLSKTWDCKQDGPLVNRRHSEQLYRIFKLINQVQWKTHRWSLPKLGCDFFRTTHVQRCKYLTTVRIPKSSLQQDLVKANTIWQLVLKQLVLRQNLPAGLLYEKNQQLSGWSVTGAVGL